MILSGRYGAMAQSYTEAARRLIHAPGDFGEIRAPGLHLIAHAFELSLKAVLAHGGWDAERLIMGGHNLDSCYHRAVAMGLPERSEMAELIEELHGPHYAQSFRYPSGIYRPPELDPRSTLALLEQHMADVDAVLSVELVT
ncbi:hypothetical protein [Caulobacter soli]|uniref:hypothetical protein n=1 Tax=Caulobacter soli TaxID=2708539 RepID=UPI0013E99F14|nr:hypothetical protein [Caulobacter soli]